MFEEYWWKCQDLGSRMHKERVKVNQGFVVSKLRVSWTNEKRLRKEYLGFAKQFRIKLKINLFAVLAILLTGEIQLLYRGWGRDWFVWVLDLLICLTTFLFPLLILKVLRLRSPIFHSRNFSVLCCFQTPQASHGLPRLGQSVRSTDFRTHL